MLSLLFHLCSLVVLITVEKIKKRQTEGNCLKLRMSWDVSVAAKVNGRLPAPLVTTGPMLFTVMTAQLDYA